MIEVQKPVVYLFYIFKAMQIYVSINFILQVLQKHNQVEKQRSKGHSSHFLLPQILVLIFRFLSGCEDAASRIKIIGDLLDLLDSDPSNVEAFMVLVLKFLIIYFTLFKYSLITQVS